MTNRSRIFSLVLEGEQMLCFLDPLMEEIAITDRRLLFTRSKGNEIGVVIVPLKNIQAVEVTDPKVGMKGFVRVMFGGDWHTFNFAMKDSPGKMYAALLQGLGW